MKSLSLLLAILVSLQCIFEITAAFTIDENTINDLQRQPQPRRRRLGIRVIKTLPPVVEFQPGRPMVLECNVSGIGVANMKWFRNGEPVNTYEEEVTDYPVHSSSISIMHSRLVVTTAAAGDVFTCLATSRGIQDSASTTVVIAQGNEAENLMNFQKLFQVPPAPIITSFLESLLQNAGTDILLPCRVHSATKTRIYWEDENFNLIYGNPKFQVLKNGDLLVRDFQFEDRGDYSCIATDMYGRNDTVTTFVYAVSPD